jgi:hypothetical protein
MEDGRALEGTAVQIVQQMQSIAFGRDRDTLAQYIDWVQRQTSEFMGVTLAITGETGEQRAASLVDELLRAGLAARI